MTEAEKLALAIALAKAKGKSAQPAPPEPESPGLGQTIADVLKSLGSGAARGSAQLVGLPGTISDLMDIGAKRAGLLTENAPGSPLSGASLERGMSALTGGATAYQPQTTPGQYAGTVAEFLPGAVALGGGGILGPAVRYGVIPGLASETAGQLTEGTAAEPWARTGAALTAGFLAGRPGAFPGDDEAARMANVLRDAGVDVTTGQARQSQPLMRLEGRLAPDPKQLDDFTAATMRQLGSPAKTATPESLRAVERAIVGQMDDAVRGADIIPTTQHAASASSVAAGYVDRVPAGQLTPRIAGIAKEIRAFAAKRTPIPLDRVKIWRSDIGALTTSPDNATREAAHGLRSLMDDMTDTALTSAGRADDITKLAKAREAYRNYIGVRDAASRAGAEGGTLSPQSLNQSVIRAQGRENYATGRTTPMADFTRSAAAALRPAPTVQPGGVRTVSEALPAALGAMGAAGAFGAGMSPMGIAAAGVASALAPAVAQMGMRSAPVQSLLRDPARAIAMAGRVAPGLLAGNAQ
jgi:hypothetical protein